MNIIHTDYLQYVRQLVDQGKIRVEGSMPLKPGDARSRTLLNVKDVEAYAKIYQPRDADPDARSYEIRCNGEQWQKVKPLLEALDVVWADLTERRRKYARKHYATKKADAK